jgi:PAS domain S-box-containing protein
VDDLRPRTTARCAAAVHRRPPSRQQRQGTARDAHLATSQGSSLLWRSIFRTYPERVRTLWRPWGLKAKLVASFVALSAAITLASLLAGQYVHSRADGLRAQHAVVSRAAQEIGALAASADEEGFSYVLAGDPDERKLAVGKLESAEKLARALHSNSTLSAREGAALDGVILSLTRLRLASTGMLDEFGRSHAVARRQYDAYDRAIDGATEAIEALDRAALEESTRARESSHHTSNVLTVIIGLLALLGAVGGGSLIGSRITRSLLELRDAASAFGAGHPDITVAHKPADEVGELATAFERMAITTRQQVAFIEHSQRHLEDVFSSMSEILLVCDSNGIVTAVNAAFLRLGGYAREEIIGVPAARLFRNAATGVRDELLRAQGGVVPVQLSTSPLAGVDGGRVVVGQDLTERRRLEAQLVTAQKLEALGRVAGSVAHDFNNILGAILTCSELALEAVGDGHPACADMRDIVDASRRGSMLTQQLLSFSRPQSASPRTLSINEAVESIGPMLTRLAGQRVKVRMTLDPSAPLVRLDATQLDQVLMNLVVNARDATPAGGEVHVRTSREELKQATIVATGKLEAGSYAVVEVRDHGTGMDEATMARLFEPFFTTKEPGKGTGLGLATVARIVQQAGGAVALESALGEGATFRVYYPCPRRLSLRASRATVCLESPVRLASPTPQTDGDVLSARSPASRRSISSIA